ncbi:MAG: ABC transporter ATP-binding protein [Chitinophagaceae bacterium]
MSSAAVSIKKLGFRYPGQNNQVFSSLDMEVLPGERFGLFGPNGAGKTTLLNCMTGLVEFQEGSIHLLGQLVNCKKKEVNRLFGFVPQDFSFYQELTAFENLEFFGAWSGLERQQIRKRSAELLDVLGLSAVGHKQVQQFSGGMKRRVNLAIAVMHAPSILFLDEPTVGVDVQTRHAIINYLKELNRNGTTLIYTSHQLQEAEDLCEKVALIDEGKIIANDSLSRLLKEYREEGLEGLYLKVTGKAYRDS